MSIGLLLGVGLVYVAVAIDLWWQGKVGLGLAFLAYALANVGFAWDLWRG